MTFEEQFREQYRATLLFARSNDCNGTIEGLKKIYLLLAEQYNKNNGDPILIKAQLSSWKDIFEEYIAIIQQNGLQDKRIQKFFGLIQDSSSPSLTDLFSGNAQTTKTEPKPLSPTPPPKKVSESKPKKDDAKPAKIPVDFNDITMLGIEPEKIEPVKVAEPTPGNQSDYVLPVTPIDPMDAFLTDTKTQQSAPAPLPTPVPVPLTPSAEEEVETYNPQSLKGFIGQQHIVRPLLKEIAIAKREGRKHLDNILLFGNPGLGKTTIMELIAKELGVAFELLDCTQFRNSQQSLKGLQNFFMRIARNNEPVVIALDEIHMLTSELQSSLLTLLNNRVYVSPLDVNGQCKRIPIDEFTFIAATTDDDKVLDTIKNRCLRLKFQMVEYSFEELKLIYKNKVKAKGLTITEEAIDSCIPRSRGAIRYVNSIIEGLDSTLYDDDGNRISTHIDLAVAKKYFCEKGIDPIGLEKKDLEILHTIEADTNGAISAEVLSAIVGMSPQKYTSEHERYLIKIGFIAVSGRGRSLTEKAIKYLQEQTKDSETV